MEGREINKKNGVKTIYILFQDAGKRIHFLDYRIRAGRVFGVGTNQDKIKSSNSIPFKAPFLLNSGVRKRNNRREIFKTK